MDKCVRRFGRTKLFRSRAEQKWSCLTNTAGTLDDAFLQYHSVTEGSLLFFLVLARHMPMNVIFQNVMTRMAHAECFVTGECQLTASVPTYEAMTHACLWMPVYFSIPFRTVNGFPIFFLRCGKFGDRSSRGKLPIPSRSIYIHVRLSRPSTFTGKW